MLTQPLVPVFLVAAALALVFDHAGGIMAPTTLLASFALVAATCYRLLPAVGGEAFPTSRAHVFMFVWLGWLFVLVYTSTLPENSIQFGWRLASFALVFLAVYGIARETWRFGFGLLVVPGLASAIWGIAEFVSTGVRANGPLIDPSTWGAIQNLFFFATVALFLTARDVRGWRGPVYVTAIAIFALAVMSAWSRAGSFLFWMALVFIAVATLRLPRLRPRVAAVVVTAVFAFGAVNLVSDPEQATGHTEGYTLDTESFAWGQRALMWEAAIDIYREYPFFGSGPGTFKVHYPRYRDMAEERNSGNFVHNDYLQFLSEGGPVMLAFLLAVVGFLAFRLIVAVTGVLKGREDHLESLLIVVAMGTPLTHALINFPLYQLQILMVLGFLFARVVHLASGQRTARLAALERPVLGQVALVFIAIASILPVTLDLVSQDLILDQDRVPFVHHLGDDSESYVDTLSTLTKIRSRNAMNHLGMATVYRTTFDSTRDPAARRSLGVATALEYQRGLELNPYHGKARSYYAEFLRQEPWLMSLDAIGETPESLYKDGIDRFPTYVEPYLKYARYLISTGRRDEAYQLLAEEALPWSNHRYDGYRVARLELFEYLSRQAIARGDRETLLRLMDQLDRGWRDRRGDFEQADNGAV